MSVPPKNNYDPQQSHDMNNHLAVIRLYAQLGLRHSDLAPDLKEGFETMLAELDKIRALRDRSGQFGTLQGNLPGMVYRCLNEPGWTMEFVSEGCLPLTGYRPEEMLQGKAVEYEDVIHPSDRKMVSNKVQEGVRKKKPFTIEYRIITKEGVEKWVWERGQEIVSLDGKQTWLEGFIMDITERKKAQQALQESEEKYSIAFHSAPYAMIISRLADGYILDVNSSFEQMSGFQRSEIIGNTTIGAEIWVLPEEREAVIKDLSENIPIRNREYKFYNKKKEVRSGLLSIDIVTINNEPFLLSSYFDITERRKMEDELRSTQEKLLGIIRVAPSGIGLVKDRVLLEVNERICEMTGYSVQELVGKSSRLLYPTQEEFEYVGKEKYAQIRESGIGIVESRWLRKDGSIIFVMLASTPMFPGDNSKGVIFTVLDITERKRVAEEQRQMKERLAEVQRMEMVGRLAGGVAHEFNNALQIIKTYAELSLIKEGENETLRSYLEQILATVRQSSLMISQLLAYARKQAVSPEVIGLNKLIEDMTVMLQKLIGDSIVLEWRPGEQLWPVHMDPAQVNQVIINLVLNARDAISDKGRIVIGTKNETLDENSAGSFGEAPSGDYVMLSVSDDGEGMDKRTMENIFEPFFTTKAKLKGTGLGLSTVYGIVRQNGGHIFVDSKKGHGSQFKLYFPRHNP